MSTFVAVADGKAVINLDQVAYVENVTGWAVDGDEDPPISLLIHVVFAAVAANEDDDADPDPLILSLHNNDAEQFMNAIMRRAEVW